MKRTLSLEAQLFAIIFPFAGADTNPASWRQFVKRRLEPEVRSERERFYGLVDAHHTAEGRHPGLDYSYAPHRRRLARWPHHKSLFAAMDELRLTRHDIRNLCCWDGSLADKRRYERKHGLKIVDTTGHLAHQRMLCQHKDPLHECSHDCSPTTSPKARSVSDLAQPPLPTSTSLLRSSVGVFDATAAASLASADAPALPHLGLMPSVDSPETARTRPAHGFGAAFENDDSSLMDPDFESWLKEQEAHDALSQEYANLYDLTEPLVTPIPAAAVVAAWNM